ncbi:MAG: hypothetical protein HXY22_07765 [Alphaproteobacteria bacterium]|nr:hypothetical protein [Alphaproteobacteria bacterium]
MKDEHFVVHLGPHYGPLLRCLAAHEGFEQPHEYAERLLGIALSAIAEVKRRDAAGEFEPPPREPDAEGPDFDIDDEVPF